jgi:hypothetical protein
VNRPAITEGIGFINYSWSDLRIRVLDYYNYQRYHEGLGDVTPYDVYTGRYLEIIRQRKEVKSRTLQARRDYNRTAREQGSGL